MKAFEKWFDNWKKEDPKHRNNFWYVLLKPFMKMAWRASLEWALKIDYLYFSDVVIKKIQKELEQ